MASSKDKNEGNIFWRPICPFSISDEFERMDKMDKKIRGYIYEFCINPDPYFNKFAILTPKTISNVLELPYIKYNIHFPDYKEYEYNNNQNTIYSKPMSSNIYINCLLFEYYFTSNEWHWILEFNKIIFTNILYPNLINWIYEMNEIQSFELRNYLILILNDNKEIDWKLIEKIVKYYYCKENESYDMKELLIDLMTMKCLEDIVLFENERYFVPLNQSKQRIIPYIKQIINDYKEEEKDLNEMNKLLQDDDNENIDNNIDIIDKIKNNYNGNLNLLSLRFDKIHHFIENVTDSLSLIYNKNNKKQWVIQPVLEYIDIHRNGIYKAPFDVNFFYGLLRIPFILFQFERIFRILQFIQSQQYLLNKPISGYLDSFLMKIPLLTLSKIIYQNEISIPYKDLFKNVGTEILTLIYSTSSILILLSSSSSSDSTSNILDITQNLMINSVSIFRKTLESNQIIHYFSPSNFRNSYWRPSRFYNISSSTSNIKELINNYFKYIAETRNGYNINQYISTLLYPIINNKKLMKISNKYIFGIINDLFSSIWYYNYGKFDKLNDKYLNKLFIDYNNMINWMQINKILNLSLKNITKITNYLDDKTKILNISNDYTLFEFYKQQSISNINISSVKRKRSLLNITDISQNNEKKEEKKKEKKEENEEKKQIDKENIDKNDDVNIALLSRSNTIELTKSLSIGWNNTDFDALNPYLQSIICKFVRNVEYDFEYPPILITIIDPFYILRDKDNNNDKLTFELLYDLGNIVLNFIITLSVATNSYYLLQNKNKQKQHKLPYQNLKGMKKLLFYKKCLTSNKYLSHKCRLHRLYKHIITKNKKEKQNENDISSELIAAFMVSIIGAIYLDSNINKLEEESLNHITESDINKLISNNDGIQLKNIWNFIERFLPEIVFQEDIKNIIHLLRINTNNINQQNDIKKRSEMHQKQKSNKPNNYRYQQQKQQNDINKTLEMHQKQKSMQQQYMNRNNKPNNYRYQQQKQQNQIKKQYDKCINNNIALITPKLNKMNQQQFEMYKLQKLQNKKNGINDIKQLNTKRMKKKNGFINGNINTMSNKNINVNANNMTFSNYRHKPL